MAARQHSFSSLNFCYFFCYCLLWYCDNWYIRVNFVLLLLSQLLCFVKENSCFVNKVTIPWLLWFRLYHGCFVKENNCFVKEKIIDIEPTDIYGWILFFCYWANCSVLLKKTVALLKKIVALLTKWLYHGCYGLDYIMAALLKKIIALLKIK